MVYIYNKDEGCPFCHGKDVKAINKNQYQSDLICTHCGAVFYSLEHTDEKAGLFTGKTEPIPNESLQKLNKGQ